MSKAVLVIDMPESCVHCKIQDWFTCRITKLCHIEDSRPDWCPLVPLPERATEPIDLEDVGKDYSDGSMDGWNACLDEIIRREDK